MWNVFAMPDVVTSVHVAKNAGPERQQYTPPGEFNVPKNCNPECALVSIYRVVGEFSIQAVCRGDGVALLSANAC